MGLFWTPVLTSAYESVGQRRSLWPDLWTLKAFACYFVGLFWTPVLTSAYESVGQRSLLPDLWTLKDFCLLFFLKEIPLHPPERKRWQRDLSTSSNALSHLTRHLKHTTDPLYSGCDHIQTQHINETSKSPEMTHSSTFIVSLLLHV